MREDIAAAKSKMRVTFGGGREIKRLVEHLWEGERVDDMTVGLYGKGNGLVTLTDRRLLFTLDGVMSRASEDFPMDKVSSVQWSSGMVTGTITIFASGNKAEIKSVNKDDGKRIVDTIRARLAAPKASASTVAAPAAPASPDVFEQLERLGKLRDAGVVTPEEFDAKKAELLARL
ncbi:PH domain-containing protein [Quadrisphaera sp. INWT6]|nr:PH domain-containing protein [Quadrisphaera sp. INWT6]